MPDSSSFPVERILINYVAEETLPCRAAAVVLMLAAVLVSPCISSTATAPSGDIKKFSSADEIRDYIESNTQIVLDENYRTDGYWYQTLPRS